MFKNQSATAPQDAVEIKQQNFSQDKDLKIEDVPIHTMAQDIHEIEHPDEKTEVLPENPVKEAIAKQDLTEKQKTSPFLSPISEATAEAPQVQTKTTEADTPIPQSDGKSNPSPAKNGLLAILVSLLILVITGAGVYYFLLTHQENPELAVVAPQEPAAPEPVAEPEPVPVSEPMPELSASNPNYLTIDIGNADNNNLKNTLDGYVKKVQDSVLATPVEFLVVDLENNPVAFEVFAKKLGLTLSPETFGALDGGFSLFIYNDQSDMRLGLSVNSKNDAGLKTALAKEEKTLAQKLQPLLIPTGYKFNSAIFSQGNYNGTTIKYLNASDATNLSIDYAISDKQLLIGTSKATIRAILDRTPADETASIPTE